MIEAAGGIVHWLEAPDGTRLRAAYWPNGGRGVGLLLNGRTEFIEKYLEPVAELQARGFAVWTLDWRGQGLSSRALPDHLRGHVVDFAEYLADLDLLLDRHVRTTLAARPLIVLAHSMGGHLGAHVLARHDGLFARGILLSPMIDFLRNGLPLAVARALFGAACLVPGVAGRYGPGSPHGPQLDQPFAGNPLTTSPERYAADIALARSMPDVQLGGVTWGWLHAAVSSVARIRQPNFADRIGAPALVALAGDDRIVDNPAARAFAARLRQSELVEIAGAQHELLREQDRHRLAAWAAIDRFLAPIG